MHRDEVLSQTWQPKLQTEILFKPLESLKNVRRELEIIRFRHNPRRLYFDLQVALCWQLDLKNLENFLNYRTIPQKVEMSIFYEDRLENQLNRFINNTADPIAF